MAGPQVQHPQRPSSAYYTGLNGASAGAATSSTTTGGGGLTTSTSSHTGLHALRQMGQDSELIYRGGTQHSTPPPHYTSNGNTVSAAVDSCIASTSRSGHVIHQQPNRGGGIDTGPSASDALLAKVNSRTLQRSASGRSCEIIMDATQCRKSSSVEGDADGDIDPEAPEEEDIEQGGGGEKGHGRRRRRHRPLHRRLLTYLRSLFRSSTTQNGKRVGQKEIIKFIY